MTSPLSSKLKELQILEGRLQEAKSSLVQSQKKYDELLTECTNRYEVESYVELVNKRSLLAEECERQIDEVKELIHAVGI